MTLTKWMVGSMLAASASLTLAQQTPNPDEVYIKRITFAGSGCAQGTVRDVVAQDAKAFTLIFDAYLAEVGPNVPGGRNEAKCKLTIDLKYPQGWSYTLFRVDYRGYAGLDAGVIAKQRSKYYFQSNPGDAITFETVFKGEMDRNYHHTDELALEEVAWAPCGRQRALNIDTDIEINNYQAPNHSGLVTVDSIDGELEHIYGIRWQQCN